MAGSSGATGYNFGKPASGWGQTANGISGMPLCPGGPGHVWNPSVLDNHRWWMVGGTTGLPFGATIHNYFARDCSHNECQVLTVMEE